MARRRRRSNRSNDTARRDVQTVSRTHVLPLTDLRLIEDRRDFHPLQDYRPAGVFVFREARQVVPKRVVTRPYRPVWPGTSLSHALQFNVPQEVALCVRRKQRREVIFAKRKYGRNGARRYRRNRFSEVSCSR